MKFRKEGKYEVGRGNMKFVLMIFAVDGEM